MSLFLGVSFPKFGLILTKKVREPKQETIVSFDKTANIVSFKMYFIYIYNKIYQCKVLNKFFSRGNVVVYHSHKECI